MSLADYTTQELHAEIRRRMGTDRLSTRATEAGKYALARASHWHAIPESLIMGRGRSSKVCVARMCAMSLMWKDGFSYDDCGRFFQRERTTIYKAVKKTGAKRIPELSACARPLQNKGF